MFADLKEAQNAVAVASAQAIPEAWERLVISYEMEHNVETVQHNRLGFYIVKEKDGRYAERDFTFTTNVIDAFTRLNDASMKTNKQHWTVCEFVLDSNGRFSMDFKYDQPKRINGIHDYESYYRFNDYLKEYIASQK